MTFIITSYISQRHRAESNVSPILHHAKKQSLSDSIFFLLHSWQKAEGLIRTQAIIGFHILLCLHRQIF